MWGSFKSIFLRVGLFSALSLSLTLLGLGSAHIHSYGSAGSGSFSWLQGNGLFITLMEAYWLVQEHKYSSAIVMEFLRFQGKWRRWETPVSHFISSCLSVWRGNRNSWNLKSICTQRSSGSFDQSPPEKKKIINLGIKKTQKNWPGGGGGVGGGGWGGG